MRHKGFEPILTGVEFAKYKKDARTSASLPLLTSLAGCKSDGGNTLLTDFIFFAQKLEKLGFMYHDDTVVIIDPVEAQ